MLGSPSGTHRDASPGGLWKPPMQSAIPPAAKLGAGAVPGLRVRTVVVVRRAAVVVGFAFDVVVTIDGGSDVVDSVDDGDDVDTSAAVVVAVVVGGAVATTADWLRLPPLHAAATKTSRVAPTRNGVAPTRNGMAPRKRTIDEPLIPHPRRDTTSLSALLLRTLRSTSTHRLFGQKGSYLPASGLHEPAILMVLVSRKAADRPSDIRSVSIPIGLEGPVYCFALSCHVRSRTGGMGYGRAIEPA